MSNKNYDKLIKAPSWKPDAILTEHGWRHPITGELLISRKIPKDVLDYYNDTRNADKPVLTEVPDTVSDTVLVSDVIPEKDTVLVENTTNTTVEVNTTVPELEHKPKRNYKKKPK